MCSSGGFLGQRLCCIYAFVFLQPLLFLWGLPRWLSVKESACQTGDTGLIPEDPLEKEMATHSSTLFFFLIFY